MFIPVIYNKSGETYIKTFIKLEYTEENIENLRKFIHVVQITKVDIEYYKERLIWLLNEMTKIGQIFEIERLKKSKSFEDYKILCKGVNNYD